MKFSYLDILSEIKQKYKGQVNENLTSLKIVQSRDGCFLHSEYSDEPNSLYIENMEVIGDDDLVELFHILNASMFKPNVDVEENAKKFINELDALTIMMCFDKIILPL